MSYTRLRYHLVYATKTRRRLLTPPVESLAHRVHHEEAERLGAKIIAIGGDLDHIHQVAAIPPTLAVSDYVRDVKKAATKAIRDDSPELGFAWQDGYGAFTLNAFDFAEAVWYVRNQKEHHRTRTLREIFECVSTRGSGGM